MKLGGHHPTRRGTARPTPILPRVERIHADLFRAESSEPGKVYLVRLSHLEAEGRSIYGVTCECLAGQNDRVCRHVRAVGSVLVASGEARPGPFGLEVIESSLRSENREDR